MSENLKVHDMVCHWTDKLGLSGWTIITTAINKASVTYAAVRSKQGANVGRLKNMDVV